MRGVIVLCTVLLLMSAACSLLAPDDIKVTPRREFRYERRHTVLEPVILIPGILGSRLFNTENGEIAWGSFSASVSELKDDLALPIRGPSLADNFDHLAAYRVLDRAEVLLNEGSGEVSIYAEIIDYLTRTLGYRPAYGRRFHAGHNLFVFFYDWRRSNVEAALQLGEMIRNIRRDLSAPKMKFTFLAVSNGGLIARYYIRYGAEDHISDRAPGAPFPDGGGGVHDCRRLICLGTPHTGTVDAFRMLHEGFTPGPLARRHPPATVFSFVSTFELLPEPGERMFVGDGGELLDIDHWDPEVWEEYGFSVFSQYERERLFYDIAKGLRKGQDRDALVKKETDRRRRHLRLCLRHAKRFRISIMGRPEVPTTCILGATTSTLARIGLTRTEPDEGADVYFSPRFVWREHDAMAKAMYARGDGVVTRRSGLGVIMPQSDEHAAARSRMFRASLKSWTLTSFVHRNMFEDELLRLALAETLVQP